jgi:hypothetical protein
MFRFEDWKSAQAGPHADSFVDAGKTSLLMDICRSLRGNDSAGAILEKAYADAVPISVTLELMWYRWTLDSLVDTKAIEQGWNERNAISFANMERKAEERRREFVGMVARLPQNQPPSQPEGLPIDRANRRSSCRRRTRSPPWCPSGSSSQRGMDQSFCWHLQPEGLAQSLYCCNSIQLCMFQSEL